MDFDWDTAKSQANLEEHGISFDEARHIFDGPVLTWVDDRQDYGEKRYISIGAFYPRPPFSLSFIPSAAAKLD